MCDCLSHRCPVLMCAMLRAGQRSGRRHQARRWHLSLPRSKPRTVPGVLPFQLAVLSHAWERCGCALVRDCDADVSGLRQRVDKGIREIPYDLTQYSATPTVRVASWQCAWLERGCPALTLGMVVLGSHRAHALRDPRSDTDTQARKQALGWDVELIAVAAAVGARAEAWVGGIRHH